MAERFSGRFLYRRGQQVRFGVVEGQERMYTILQQRYTRRDVLGPLYEYLLTSSVLPHSFWANEADLEATEEV